MAGLQITSGSGDVTRSSQIRLRGTSTLQNDQGPMIVIDGVPGGDMSTVSPSDIESISVLKDASSAAIYGSRAAGGVILITTKKGKEGKPAINVRTEFGFTSPTKKPKMLGSAEWAELYNEAYESKYYSESDIQKYRDGSDPDLYPNVDWFDSMFNDLAQNQRVNLSVTGGGDVVKYYVSGSFYHENSIYKSAGNMYGYDSSLSLIHI